MCEIETHSVVILGHDREMSVRYSKIEKNIIGSDPCVDQVEAEGVGEAEAGNHSPIEYCASSNQDTGFTDILDSNDMTRMEIKLPSQSDQ